MNKTNESVDANSLLREISVSDDKRAFETLFDLYYPALCIYAKRFIGNRATREDIVQDVFYTLWEKRKLIDITTSAKSYLLAILKNVSLNHLRKQGCMDEYAEMQRIRTESDPREHPYDLYTLSELEALLERALEKLPDEYRIAFVMSRLELKKTSEIAEVLGVSTRTVERYRDRALHILQYELRDYLPLCFLLSLFSTS